MKINQDLITFITGGASGLGEATVRELYAKGAKKICVADFNTENLKALQKDLPEILIVKCDVSNEQEVKSAIE